ncbi:alpha/beta hydrolase [Cognatilysobacter terrigena]|uniref:alpha/beta hydrolase n=1 Tax=Cognatilysobacter terrigena TaxID=2488749 RepID=UPI00105C4A36|nr:alpha/beta fold hydrolase [Lysobacter terrigena]
MKRLDRSALAAVLVASIAAFPAAYAAPPATAIATHLIDELDAGHFDAAAKPFDATMRAAVPPDRLAGVWKSLPSARSRGTATTRTVNDTTIVTIPLHREGADFDAQVAIGADGAIKGFMVRPAASPPAPAAPADAPFTETQVSIGTGATALPATLAMPKGAGPFPAVVLVHGSGPQDRDETIGANRPFLDLARGLASKGIAVLRYEKRTRVHPEQFAGHDFNVDDETTNDAVAAIEALRTQRGIDAAHVYVLGHSQGAMLAPRIATRSGHVAGVVMLAAPARRLLDLLPEQNRYIANLDGNVSDAEKTALAKIDSAIAAIRSGRALAPTDAPLGLSAAYWRSIDAVDPLADARALKLPMLLLQGGRDFQVTNTDWALWQQAFGHDPRATLHLYPALDHLAITGTGASTLKSYDVPGHVDAQLINDVAAWIEGHR